MKKKQLLRALFAGLFCVGFMVQNVQAMQIFSSIGEEDLSSSPWHELWKDNKFKEFTDNVYAVLNSGDVQGIKHMTDYCQFKANQTGHPILIYFSMYGVLHGLAANINTYPKQTTHDVMRALVILLTRMDIDASLTYLFHSDIHQVTQKYKWFRDAIFKHISPVLLNISALCDFSEIMNEVSAWYQQPEDQFECAAWVHYFQGFSLPVPGLRRGGLTIAASLQNDFLRAWNLPGMRSDIVAQRPLFMEAMFEVLKKCTKQASGDKLTPRQNEECWRSFFTLDLFAATIAMQRKLEQERRNPTDEFVEADETGESRVCFLAEPLLISGLAVTSGQDVGAASSGLPVQQALVVKFPGQQDARFPSLSATFPGVQPTVME